MAAIVRPPHHADPRRLMGFYFNNVATLLRMR
jgi:acetoin utilization deacetylase AcuC-like enzyme